MSDSFAERALHAICLFQTQLVALFAICVLLFILTLASLFVLDPGTPGYAVSILNLGGVVFFGGVSGALVFLCQRRGQPE